MLIHTLYDEQLALHKQLLLNCVKPAVIRTAAEDARKLTQIDVNSARNQLGEADVVICDEACKAVAPLPPERQTKFFRRFRDFYCCATIQVRQRLPLHSPVLAGAHMLSPTTGKEQPAAEVASFA